MSRAWSRFVRILCIASLFGPGAAFVQAQPAPIVLPAPPPPTESSGLSPTIFWIAASATIITASLGGFYAIHVKDLYDEANLQPLISPERSRIRDEMETAEVTADVLLLGSIAMAIGSTILTFYIDWSEADRARQPSAATGDPPRRSWW